MTTVERTSHSPDALRTSERDQQHRYALISVFDKAGIVDLARTIDSLGYRIISTGGTAKALTDAGLSVVPIQDITGNPESFDGRMKTISFQIEGGILYDRTNRDHRRQARELGVPNIGIVVANLYPFEQTVAKPGVRDGEIIEMIDVGGPTMVRAAAKNHKNVLVITDPADYESIAEELRQGPIGYERRRALAAKAFRHLSFYDAQVARELGEGGDIFPEVITIPARRVRELRYGENPHQRAALYVEPGTNSPIANLQKVSGGEMSATNVTDVIAGLEVVRMYGKDTAAVVIKHNSPSGIALGSSAAEALSRAIEADSVSAFGGVIVLNVPLDMEAAGIIAKFKEGNGLIDIVAAPDLSSDAREFLPTVRKKTGIYTFGLVPDERSNGIQVKAFDGGVVLQEWDDDPDRSFPNWKVVTTEKPTPRQLRQMKFAWKGIGRVKSNTVMVVDRKLPMTRGIGSGQTSRVASTKIALAQAEDHARGGILASDSFFPFDDSVRLTAEAGIGAIVQQGGSVNDQASINAANEMGIPMVFTGERKFWH